MSYHLCSLDVVTPRYRKKTPNHSFFEDTCVEVHWWMGGLVSPGTLVCPHSPRGVMSHSLLWNKMNSSFLPIILMQMLTAFLLGLALPNLLCSLLICRARGLWGAGSISPLIICLLAILRLTLTALGREFPVWVQFEVCCLCFRPEGGRNGVCLNNFTLSGVLLWGPAAALLGGDSDSSTRRTHRQLGQGSERTGLVAGVPGHGGTGWCSGRLPSRSIPWFPLSAAAGGLPEPAEGAAESLLPLSLCPEPAPTPRRKGKAPLGASPRLLRPLFPSETEENLLEGGPWDVAVWNVFAAFWSPSSVVYSVCEERHFWFSQAFWRRLWEYPALIYGYLDMLLFSQRLIFQIPT